MNRPLEGATIKAIPLGVEAATRGCLDRSAVGNFPPRKIRELIQDLERAGFVDRGGKGSHRNDEHPSGGRVTVSGRPGDDARPYQERQVRRAIEGVES